MSSEEDDVISACRAIWRINMPAANGIIAVNVRKFVAANESSTGALGVTVQPLGCSSALLGDICRNPTPADPDNLAATILTDASIVGNSDNLLVAHEFGHALGLGHGDGVDNDGNGVFDECCDLSEGGAGFSLMSPSGGSIVITELQKRVLRAFAFHTPGTRFFTEPVGRAHLPSRIAPLPPGFDKVVAPEN